MKKNFNKKLVLKKHTMASLDAEKLEELYGGNHKIPPGPRPGPSDNLSAYNVNGLCCCYTYGIGGC